MVSKKPAKQYPTVAYSYIDLYFVILLLSRLVDDGDDPIDDRRVGELGEHFTLACDI